MARLALRQTFTVGLYLCACILLADAQATDVELQTLIRVPGASYLTTLQTARASVTKNGAKFQLVLTGVNPKATWFTDRPDRLAGTVQAKRFLNNYKALYGSVPPNVVVFGTLVADPKKTAVVILELAQPSQSAQRTTFEILRLVSPTTDMQKGYLKMASTHVKSLSELAQLKDAALFFENVGGRSSTA